MRYILSIFLLLSLPYFSTAQELECKVTVMHRNVSNVDAKVFKSLEKALNDFLQNKRWTNDNYKPHEKIECNFMLNVIKRVSENVYSATLNINANRPIFGTSYSTPLVNHREQESDFTFRFEESQNIIYDDNRVAGNEALAGNLPAVFAFYVYIILGLDYDSYSPNGGLEYLKKAQYIVQNAPEDALIKGWKSTGTTRNRYWLIEQLLSPRFDGFRTAWYNFHRHGLDLMQSEPEEAKAKIFSLIPILVKINDDNPTSFLLQFYFTAKSNEFLNIIALAPRDQRKQYVDQLSKIDVPNANKYRELLNKP